MLPIGSGVVLSKWTVASMLALMHGSGPNALTNAFGSTAQIMPAASEWHDQTFGVIGVSSKLIININDLLAIKSGFHGF